MAARGELPGGTIEQVGAHRQMTVREVQCVRRAVCIGIGKGLQNPTAGVSPHDVYYPVKLAEQREAEVKRTVENEVARLLEE